MNKNCAKILFIIFLMNYYSLTAETTLEARAGAFFHSSKLFRAIYGEVSGCYELEATTTLFRNLDGFTNFDWSTNSGKSIGLKDPTRFNIANCSFGIKVPYRFLTKLTAYVGIGPSFSNIWIKNRSRCNDENQSKFAIGGVAKVGVHYFITTDIFLDLFVDYLYQPVHFQTHVDIGGIKTGAGLGYKF